MSTYPRNYRSRSRSRSNRVGTQSLSTRPSIAVGIRGPRSAVLQSQPSIANRTSTSIEIPSQNNAEAARNRSETDNDVAFKKFFNNLIGDFHLDLFLLVIINLILLVTTQALKGGFDSAMIVFEVIMALHLLILIRQHCLCRTAAEKKENAINIVESAIYLAWLFTISASITDNKVGTPFIVVTTLLIIHHASKTLYSYSQGKHADWKFARYLNVLLTSSRVILIIQLIIILLKVNDNIKFSWRITFVPLYVIGFMYICHMFFMISIACSSISRIVLKPLNPPKVAGLLWLFGVPLMLTAAVVLSALRISQVLDSDEGYDADNTPFVSLFGGLIAAILFTMIYSYCCEQSIHMMMKYFSGIYGLDSSDREKILALAEKLREEQRKAEEDKYVPKYLIRISNAYFKIPTKAETKVGDQQQKAPEAAKPDENNSLDKQIEKNEIELTIQEEVKKTENKPTIDSLADLEKNENTKCVICFDGQPDAAYLPCGHGGACYACAKEILKTKGECHLCRCQIRRLAKLEITENTTSEHIKIISVLKKPQ